MRNIQISDHFNYFTILLFSLPTIGMLIVDSSYRVADGYFISNYIGEAAFAAENLIFPPGLLLASFGLMFGTGTSAVVSRELGANRLERARSIMTLITLVLTVIAVAVAAVFYLLLPDIARWVGAPEHLVPVCILYGEVMAIFLPFIMLTLGLQPLLITAERPGLGFAATAAEAIVNVLFNWLFVAVLGWGMRGAALGTGLAWLSGVLIPLWYFCNRKNTLHFVNPKCELKVLWEAIYNGSSEMMDTTSAAIVAMVFNLQLMEYLGEVGVAAYSVGNYVLGLFFAIFGGICMSIIPVVGYHFGAGNRAELRSLRRKGTILVGVIGVLMTIIAFESAELLAGIFLGYNESSKALAVEALQFSALTYMFSGLIFFSSAYFTGLGRGTVSLVISTFNSLIGPLVMVYLLPPFLGKTGIWLAEPVAQALTLAAVIFFCYHWWKRN